ncbi:alpha-ketoglutarate-dependent dioxygenase AlkB [Arthrobacter sp. CAN_C5]|uniref:alpha-ketoglutarate-dependent dioxygenase AlkB family protein n=1 Tax=Arthrobacter sp. CAN_C5 TaxID=2760706 RepID=UPI001AE991EC|nr:alpha-ketoglutarate-dependent dioxygenase AlkB [Arthrobacter sp. CAN_C5]MBP2214991.1 alkylated DNA repair protein (DNA oxidative demethylase) [Arthrobacter sp. CAN_C5]
MESLLPRERSEPSPGAVHLPGWLSLEQQQELIDACRKWATGPVPMRAARMPNGSMMSVKTVCLGWHWQPYRYTRTADDAGGGQVAEFPDWLVQLGRDAVAAAYGDPAHYAPDAALINFYNDGAAMGMHQDKDEVASAPVVSLSIGDSCIFRFGNTETRNKPWTDLTLESGDLFVFGGPSRLAYHGVTKTYPGTADPALGLKGRLNLTLRETGLS